MGTGYGSGSVSGHFLVLLQAPVDGDLTTTDLAAFEPVTDPAIVAGDLSLDGLVNFGMLPKLLFGFGLVHAGSPVTLGADVQLFLMVLEGSFVSEVIISALGTGELGLFFFDWLLERRGSQAGAIFLG